MEDFPAPAPSDAPKTDSAATKYAGPSVIYALAGFIAAVGLVIVVLLATGRNDDSSSEKTGVAVETTEAPAPVDPGPNKYDKYYENVLNNSGIANSRSKSSVIETGDLVCQSLDEGNTVRAVATVLEGASNTQSELEYAAAIMYWAITDLCPEYKRALDVYLGN